MKLYCLGCHRPVNTMPVYPVMTLTYYQGENSYKASSGELSFEPGCPNQLRGGDYCKSQKIVKSNKQEE